MKSKSVSPSNDEEIEKLSAFQKSRIRTEMYFGPRDPHTQIVLEYVDQKPVAVETTWVPALFTAFREILDNALDELVKHGGGTRLDICYDPITLTMMVHDHGRGIPISFNKTHKQYAATMAMSEEHTGRNFGENRGDTRGMNGVGGSITNFCSEWFQMDIWRDGKHFNQRFSEGDGSRNGKLHIEDPIILPLGRQKQTGTRIEFKLSSHVFKNRQLPEKFIKSRIFEIGLCYPHLSIFYNGEKFPNCKAGVEKILFPDKKPISIEIDEPGFKSNFWLVPNFFETDGSISELNHSLVNCIPMFNGGTHINTFRLGFFNGMLSALEKESKKRKLSPNRSDLSDGMLLYNITQMDEPSFDGQAKMRLGSENVSTLIKKALDDPDFFKAVIRKNPDWIEDVYTRCAERTQSKDDKDAAKMAKKNLRNKVAELEDACGVDRSKCILFLAEGKSAISGIGEARDPNIHGALPLRGKVMNVFDESPKSVLENQALAKVMTAIGLIPGQRANRHLLRYGKIYITTDSDEDGKNIAALLVNFFYTFWPELFDPEKEPFIYLFDTPFIIARKGNQVKYWYAEEYDKFHSETYKSWDVFRAKGLAGLIEKDWEWVLNNPKSVPITDDGHLKEALTLLFDGSKADERKKWIGI